MWCAIATAGHVCHWQTQQRVERERDDCSDRTTIKEKEGIILRQKSVPMRERYGNGEWLSVAAAGAIECSMCSGGGCLKKNNIARDNDKHSRRNLTHTGETIKGQLPNTLLEDIVFSYLQQRTLRLSIKSTAKKAEKCSRLMGSNGKTIDIEIWSANGEGRGKGKSRSVLTPAATDANWRRQWKIWSERKERALIQLNDNFNCYCIRQHTLSNLRQMRGDTDKQGEKKRLASNYCWCKWVQRTPSKFVKQRKN